uniref:Uncharacterized protein n=1 Tax=Anguilla anguilla TaxID=7936 RepID=A0A0E9W464_ANGAN
MWVPSRLRNSRPAFYPLTDI